MLHLLISIVLLIPTMFLMANAIVILGLILYQYMFDIFIPFNLIALFGFIFLIGLINSIHRHIFHQIQY